MTNSYRVQLHVRACISVTRLLPWNRSTVHIVRRGQPGAMLVSERQRQSSEEGRPSLQVIKHRREKPHARNPARPAAWTVLERIRWQKMYSQLVGRRPSPVPGWKEDLGHARVASIVCSARLKLSYTAPQTSRQIFLFWQHYVVATLDNTALNNI